MAEHSIDRKKLLDDMKIERAKLFGKFMRHPKDARLALAIKIIDDEIAECAEWIRTKDKSSEIAAKNTTPLQKDSFRH